METELKYGPQTPQIEALIETVRSLTTNQIDALNAAWDALWNEAWGVALGAALDVWRYQVWGAVAALLVRDFIGDSFTQSDYDILTTPWRKVVGPIHPDDINLRGD